MPAAPDTVILPPPNPRLPIAEYVVIALALAVLGSCLVAFWRVL